VVPGLWHLVTGNLARIRLLETGWLVSLSVGLLLAGTTAASWLVGTAIALHAAIVCDAADVRTRARHWSTRVAVMLLAFAALALFPYTVAARFARRYVVISPSGAALRDEGLRAGDRFLVWRRSYKDDGPERGDLAIYDIRPVSGTGYRLRGARLASRVLGVPGDCVSLDEDGVHVTDPGGCGYEYPVPGGLGVGTVELELGKDEYFCLPPELSAGGHGAAPSKAQQVRMTAVARRQDFRGRAFMVWSPLRRRRLLRRTALLPVTEDEQ
jgi:signal peptidase I